MRSLPIESFVEALKREKAIPALFAYAAKHLAGKPGVCDAMVENKNCAAEYLVPVARYLSALSILALMELLGSAMDEAALAEAAAEAEPDAVRRQSLLQRLAKMNVSERVQFAIKGGPEARRTLIRDSNKVVQRAVLQSPRLTDQDVEAFAAMSSLTDGILRLIASNRSFRKNYSVVRNLLNNPKTPLDVSLHMLPLINALDLKKLCMNKNIPETLRSTAVKLQRTRVALRK